jgi:hypothetical protein
MRIQYFVLFLFTVLLVLGSSTLPAAGQGDPPKADLPVLLTSCGQSPGANMLKAIFMRAIKENPPAYTLIMDATPEDLNQAAEAGRPFKSMIIVMGASLKGMGAAGISMDDELDRTAELIQAARASGITVIGAHIEGMKRRAQGASAGDNTDELSIDAVAPNSDFLIINQDGDSDKRFTTIANEKKFPMLTVTKNLELLEVVTKVFGR